MVICRNFRHKRVNTEDVVDTHRKQKERGREPALVVVCGRREVLVPSSSDFHCVGEVAHAGIAVYALVGQVLVDRATLVAMEP